MSPSAIAIHFDLKPGQERTNMLRTLMTAATLAISASCFTASAHAAEDQMDHTKTENMKMDHGQMDHGAMNHDVKPGVTEASGVGVINAVDSAKKQVNVTHEPIPALSWPSMTMDLPVTRSVDLGAIKAGDKVTFRLKLGRDKVYRIMEMAPAK